MPDPTRILLIEDDVPLASLISEYLRGQDFRIDVELRGDIVARRTSCKFVFS
jgi:DNA-binding response OmpR family regulator